MPTLTLTLTLSLPLPLPLPLTLTLTRWQWALRAVLSITKAMAARRLPEARPIALALTEAL